MYVSRPQHCHGQPAVWDSQLGSRGPISIGTKPDRSPSSFQFARRHREEAFAEAIKQALVPPSNILEAFAQEASSNAKTDAKCYCCPCSCCSSSKSSCCCGRRVCHGKLVTRYCLCCSNVWRIRRMLPVLCIVLVHTRYRGLTAASTGSVKKPMRSCGNREERATSSFCRHVDGHACL